MLFSQIKLSKRHILPIGILVILLFVQSRLFGFNPVVELGPDTVSCGSPIVLDAGNPGATFLWSTGAISQSISVSTSDLYWVEVTDGTGTTRDSITVEVLSTPTSPTLSDTTICKGEKASYQVPSAFDGTIWFDSPSGGNALAIGDTFSRVPDITESIYASYFNYSTVKVGMPDTTLGTINYFQLGTRGELFDVLSPLTFKAVYTYANKPVTFDLIIQDGNGDQVYLQQVSITTPFVRTRIELDLVMQIGTGYRIIASNFSGDGGLAVSYPSLTVHPYTIPGLISNTQPTSTPPRDRTFYFFDWEIDKPTCFSPRAASQITVSPTPEVNLGADTLICGDNMPPFVLDATNAGASYLWNNGSTDPTFTVTETDTISIIANIGSCIATDEIKVFVFDIPDESQLSDTTVCGQQEISLNNSSTSGSSFSLWWNASNELINEGQSYSSFFSKSETFRVENINGRIFRLGPEGLDVSTDIKNDGAFTRGIRLNAFQDMVVKSLAVFPISLQDMTFDIVLRDSNAVEVTRYPQAIEPPYSREVLDVNIFIPKGNRYSLEVENLAGGSVLRNDVPADVYPFTVPNVASIIASTNNGSDRSTLYNYLYDLQVIPYTGSCVSTPKTFDIEVKLPLAIADSIYSCTDLTLDPNIVAASYLWNTGATTPTINISESGLYTLTISDGIDCQVSDSSYVEIPTDAGLVEDGILCGNTLVTNYGANSIFSWSSGESTPTIMVTTPGTYSVEVMEPRGCVLRDTVVISGFDSFPIVDLGSDYSACESTVLDAGNQGLNFLWSTGETTQEITVTASGLYVVSVTNVNNCTSDDTIGVSVTPNPVAQFSIADTVIGGVSRRANFVNQSSFGSYFWDFGDGNTSFQISPSHTYADTGTYCITLIVTDIQNNCGTDTFEKCAFVLQYPVGLEKNQFGTKVDIFPNPADKEIFLSFEAPLTDHTQISLLDLRGKVIRTEQVRIQNPFQREKMSIDNIPPGIYILHLQNQGKLLTRKIMVN